MSPRRFVTALGPSRSSPRHVSAFSAALGVAVAIALSGCASLGRSDTAPSGLVPFFGGNLDGDEARLSGPIGMPALDARLALEGDRLSIIHSGTQRFSF